MLINDIIFSIATLIGLLVLFVMYLIPFIQVFKPERDYEYCNRIMGTTFESEEEYKKSGYYNG